MSVCRRTTGGRRGAVVALVIAAVLAPAEVGTTRLAAQDAAADPFARDRVDDALRKAADFLRARQRDDGSISDTQHNATAMTALSVMALAAVGHQPIDPTDEGKAMRRALEYVLRDDRIDGNGYFGSRDNSRMYGHGIITLMLAEMLGMGADDDMDRRILKRLVPAVKLILRSQAQAKHPQHAGGWRYTPQTNDADLSVTVWQLMALRSARNAGLDVPAEAIDRAAQYVRRSFHGDNSRRPNDAPRDGYRAGAFAYQPGQHPTYAMAAAGMLSLQVSGQYEAPEVLGAADWLLGEPINYGHHWFFYGTYYYAQSMYQRGGDYANTARRRVEQVLLPRQDGQGSWIAAGGQERHAGQVYSTTLAMLSLSVKHHYLPIYQR